MYNKDSKNSSNKCHSKDEALLKLQKYCAYQDRCHSEVRTKLISLKIYGGDLEDIITDLIAEDFLNEERFARSFARGKFRIKRWGRNKIKSELKFKRVSDYCIRKGLNEIDPEEYQNTLYNLIEKKDRTLKSVNQYDRYQKLYKYVYGKGYEAELIKKSITEIIND